MIIKTSSANLYKKPSFKSELVTQGLLWEEVEILDKKNNWYKIKQWDNYISWVHKFYLSDEKNKIVDNYYKVPIQMQKIYANPNESLEYVDQVLFGTNLPIKDKINSWYNIFLPNNKIGYLKSINSKTNFIDTRLKIINKAKLFLGVPYLWGGNTSLGFDCSGLIQAIFRFFEISIERDTSKQIYNKYLDEISFKSTELGDLIFFYINDVVNHVGLIINNSMIIHSSGCVLIESIDKIINRLKNDGDISIKLFSINRLLKNKVNND